MAVGVIARAALTRTRPSPHAAAITRTALAWYRVFNGVGRFAWGTITDRIGRKATIVLMTTALGLIMRATCHVFVTFGDVAGCHRRLPCRLQSREQFRPVSSRRGGLLRQQDRGQQLWLAVHCLGIARIAGYFKDSGAGAAQPVARTTPFIIASAACMMGAVTMALPDASAARRTLTAEEPPIP